MWNPLVHCSPCTHGPLQSSGQQCWIWNFVTSSYNSGSCIGSGISALIIFKLIILDENDWIPIFNQDYININIQNLC